jgi:hypothetical protein
MTETFSQRLLRAVFDDHSAGDDLVPELAASADAQADAVHLMATLAALPGTGARAAEARLEQLLDAAAFVAVGEVVMATEHERG